MSWFSPTGSHPPMYMCTFMLCQNFHMLICGWWVSDCGCSCITWSCCIHAHLTPFHFSDVPLSYSCFYSLMPSCMCYIFSVTIQKYILSIYMLYGCILNIHTYISLVESVDSFICLFMCYVFERYGFDDPLRIPLCASAVKKKNSNSVLLQKRQHFLCFILQYLATFLLYV